MIKEIEGVKSYSLSEAQKAGMSKVVRDAEEIGLCLLKRNGAPVAMVVPLQLIPFQNYLKKLNQLIETDINNNKVPEEMKSFAYFLRAMSQMQVDMFSKHQRF